MLLLSRCHELIVWGQLIQALVHNLRIHPIIDALEILYILGLLLYLLRQTLLLAQYERISIRIRCQCDVVPYILLIKTAYLLILDILILHMSMLELFKFTACWQISKLLPTMVVQNCIGRLLGGSIRRQGDIWERHRHRAYATVLALGTRRYVGLLQRIVRLKCTSMQ